MDHSLASVDGRIGPLAEACLPVDDPAVTTGWSVFETAEALAGEVSRLDAHLDRLEASAAAACIAMPERGALARHVRDLVAEHHRRAGVDGRLRITLTGAGRVLVVVTELDPTRRHRPVRCVRGEHRVEPVLGGSVKHGSRAPWVVAVRRSGADDVLMVDAEGRFTEGTTCGIVAVVDGVVVTAPHDGRILPSTTVTALLERAEALGIPVRREGADAAGPWDGLYVASATRRLAPVVSLDGQALPAWDPVGLRLAGLDAPPA